MASASAHAFCCGSSECSPLALLLWLDTGPSGWPRAAAREPSASPDARGPSRPPRDQRDVLAFQPSARARRSACGGRRWFAPGRSLGQPRDHGPPVRADGFRKSSAEYIWTICLGLVAPVSFLTLVPRSFTDRITRSRATGLHLPRRGRAGEIRGCASAACLHRHPLRLCRQDRARLGAAQGHARRDGHGLSPRRRGDPVAGYPSRETSGPLVRLFWRYWVWLAALPVALLFIAVSRRIADYGLTEQRYLMVLIGVWALILAAFRLAQGARFDLRLLPGVLALLLLAASLGPGGAIGLSVLSQKAELASILTGKGVLVDGKIVPGGEGAAETPLGGVAARARAIEWYLNTHHSLGLLAPWFEGHPDDPFAPGKTPEETARGFLQRRPAPISAMRRARSISPTIRMCPPCSFRRRAPSSSARSYLRAARRLHQSGDSGRRRARQREAGVVGQAAAGEPR